jgi:hypothetical protein
VIALTSEVIPVIALNSDVIPVIALTSDVIMPHHGGRVAGEVGDGREVELVHRARKGKYGVCKMVINGESAFMQGRRFLPSQERQQRRKSCPADDEPTGTRASKRAPELGLVGGTTSSRQWRCCEGRVPSFCSPSLEKGAPRGASDVIPVIALNSDVIMPHRARLLLALLEARLLADPELREADIMVELDAHITHTNLMHLPLSPVSE